MVFPPKYLHFSRLQTEKINEGASVGVVGDSKWVELVIVSR